MLHRTEQKTSTHKSRRQEKHLQKIPIIVFVHSLLICTSNKRQAINTKVYWPLETVIWATNGAEKSPPAAMKSGQLLLSEAKNWISQTRCWRLGELQRSPWNRKPQTHTPLQITQAAGGTRLQDHWIPRCTSINAFTFSYPSILGGSVYILHASAGPMVRHDFIILGLTVSQDQNITNKVSAVPSTNKKSNILFSALK